MEPLVSVIIPVYNVLPYLREALDSVINQTYKNLEILIVDDGSTDGSGDICDEYLSDPRVIVIHQENKGLSGARNTALDRMTGEYVAFLDSDDAFLPEMIEKMLAAIIRNQADAAMCGYVGCYTKKHMCTPGIRKRGRHLSNQERILSPSESLNMIISDQVCWAVWDKLYQRSVWGSVRFPEGNNFEDMWVMCQILERCERVVTVPGIHVLYRQRHGSISKTQSAKNLQDYLLAVNAVEKFGTEHSPEIISSDNLNSFQEEYTLILSNRYAKMIYHPHMPGSFSQIRKDILLRWKHIDGITCQFHSRIMRFLFQYSPLLLIPSWAAWRFGKFLARKVIYR